MGIGSALSRYINRGLANPLRVDRGLSWRCRWLFLCAADSLRLPLRRVLN